MCRAFLMGVAQRTALRSDVAKATSPGQKSSGPMLAAGRGSKAKIESFGLARCALGQDALKRAAMHVQPPCRLRDVAVAHLINALDVLPPHPVGRHRVLRQFRLGSADF